MTDEKHQKAWDLYPTPFYIFDVTVLRNRISYLKSKIADRAEICYAVKANTFISGYIKDCVERFEVCSPGEFYICESQGLPAEKLVISGVYKTPEVIEDMVKRSVNAAAFTVESVNQFELLCSLAEKYRVKLPLLLRLTSGNQFGMNEEEILEIVKRRADYRLIDIRGIQYFSGTQKTSLKRLKRELEHIDEFLEDMTEQTGFHASELEFGAGFPISYFEGGEFDEDEFLTEFSAMLDEFRYDTRIILELGRSVAASCGSYVTSIVDLKTNKKENYAIVDGGMNHIVYFGQSMAMKKPYISALQHNKDGERESWNICGSLCSVNDILVKRLPLYKPVVGDKLVFKNTGAYCMTEGISLFLSRELPAVIVVDKDGKFYTARDSFETYELNKGSF